MVSEVCMSPKGDNRGMSTCETAFTLNLKLYMYYYSGCTFSNLLILTVNTFFVGVPMGLHDDLV